jgi:predicted metal-dependent peptidase
MSKYKRFKGAIRGGGGTDFIPVFDYAKKHGYNGIIFVTDLCGNFPTDNKIRTLWLSTEKSQKAPFGETVFLDLD